jgi:hypothetical protein
MRPASKTCSITGTSDTFEIASGRFGCGKIISSSTEDEMNWRMFNVIGLFGTKPKKPVKSVKSVNSEPVRKTVPLVDDIYSVTMSAAELDRIWDSLSRDAQAELSKFYDEGFLNVV